SRTWRNPAHRGAGTTDGGSRQPANARIGVVRAARYRTGVAAVKHPGSPGLRGSQPPALAGRPIRMEAPRAFARPAAPAVAPMRVAPAAARSGHAPPVKIP